MIFRKKALVIVAITSLLPGILWLVLVPASPINQANYNEIALGMTEGEVTELLGGPPGIHHQGILDQLYAWPEEAYYTDADVLRDLWLVPLNPQHWP